MAQVQEESGRSLAPCAEAVPLLDTIPSVSAVTAATLVAEIGSAMSRFPAAQPVASWAGLCPGTKQSGGKRLSGKTTKGHRWVRAALGEVAVSIARAPGNGPIMRRLAPTKP